MKTSEILELDYREEKSKSIIQKVLRKIKPLSKYSDDEDIPLDAIENVIRIMSYKYRYRVQLSEDVYASNRYGIWQSFIVVDDYTAIKCYGISIYEALAKTAIYMYSKVKKKG